MCETRSKTKLRQIKSQLQLNQLKKDSFERFGDDLCELVLSYLSVKQKLVFQRVSKQWQTLVLNKQKVLIIDNKFDLNSLKLFNNSFDYNRHKLLVKVLKKFRFINELYFNCFIDGKVLQIIANNCQHLEKISFYGSKNISEEETISFGNKCGNKLQTITQLIGEKHFLIGLLSLTPNIKYVFYPNFGKELYFGENVLKNLEKVNISDCDLQTFQVFTDIYHNYIKNIRIQLKYDFKKFLQQISRYTNLKVLHIVLYANNLNQIIDQSLLSIGKSCPKIVDFSLHEFNFYDKSVYNKSIFDTFGEFKSLKTLGLFSFTEKCGQNGSMASLSNCKDLTHLLLRISHLNDSNFENIDLYLPNLKKLSIISNNKMTDKSLFCISRMKRLSDIKYIIRDKTEENSCAITEASINAILDNHINTRYLKLNINFRLNISKELNDKIESMNTSNQLKYDIRINY